MLLLALPLLLLLLAGGSAAAAESCTAPGFTGSQACADCDKLVEYTRDEGLGVECRQCCTEPGGKAAFEAAKLVVCKHRLRDYPHVAGFVEREAARFPRLRVAFEYGRPPTLVLRAGEREEERRIDAWKTEHIVEFLQERLRPGGSGSG